MCCRGDKLKEFRIGVEVFGKVSSFDRRMDPLVRDQARGIAFSFYTLGLESFVNLAFGHDEPRRVCLPLSEVRVWHLPETGRKSSSGPPRLWHSYEL